MSCPLFLPFCQSKACSLHKTGQEKLHNMLNDKNGKKSKKKPEAENPELS